MGRYFLATLLFCLSATVAPAVTLGVNVIANGDAETGDTSGWPVNTGVVVTSTLGPPFGSYSFWGGEGNPVDVMAQTIDLTSHAASIDSGNLTFELSAQLQNRNISGFSDEVFLTLGFLDATDSLISSVVFTDTAAAINVWDWQSVFASGIVDAGTRSAQIVLLFQRSGGFSSEAFADDISLTFAVPVPAALPLFLSAIGGLGFVAWQRQKTAPCGAI